MRVGSQKKSLTLKCEIAANILDIVMKDVFVIGMADDKITDTERMFEEDSSKRIILRRKFSKLHSQKNKQ